MRLFQFASIIVLSLIICFSGNDAHAARKKKKKKAKKPAVRITQVVDIKIQSPEPGSGSFAPETLRDVRETATPSPVFTATPTPTKTATATATRTATATSTPAPKVSLTGADFQKSYSYNAERNSSYISEASTRFFYEEYVFSTKNYSTLVVNSPLIPVSQSRDMSFSIRYKPMTGVTKTISLGQGIQPYDSNGKLIDGAEFFADLNTGQLFRSYDQRSSSIELRGSPSWDATFSATDCQRYLGFYFDGNTNKRPDYLLGECTGNPDRYKGAFYSIVGTRVFLNKPLPAEVVAKLRTYSIVLNHQHNQTNGLWMTYHETKGPYWQYLNTSLNISQRKAAFPKVPAWNDIKYIRIVLYPNHNQDKTSEVLFDDIGFTAYTGGNTLSKFGDFNLDGCADNVDYEYWVRFFGKTVVPGTEADANNDGRIDAADYTAYADNKGICR